MEEPHDRITALESALADTQAQLQAERQAHLEFVSLLTHELRVPMTSIQGYADLLLKGIMGPINEAQNSFLKTIRTNIERMSRMVADMADINKANGERLQPKLESIELKPILDEAAAAVKAVREEKVQTLQMDMPDGLPAINGDRNLLTRVFQRLLDNAVQYTPEAGVITIDAIHDTEEQVVRVSIQDTGCGILADEQDRIGEIFFRASDEQTRATTGNGLSLHLCRKLIALHNGSLYFTSTRETGSTFYVTFPIH